MEDIAKKVLEHKGVRITEQELRKYVPFQDYTEYFNTIQHLVQHHILTPVGSSGSNGMNPPLHKKFSIVRPAANYDAILPEIRLLHGKLNIEGYLTDPGKYIHHQQWLTRLDRFLKNRSRELQIPASINERSFQLFGKEKALKEDSALASVLAFNPGLREFLNYYHTPEPFFTYDMGTNMAAGKPYTDGNSNVSGQAEANILIIENKDTWYTLKSLMSAGNTHLAGVRFDSLIYGEGKKIARKNDSLTEFDRSYFNGGTTRYYYFGDLDYEGTWILQDLIRNNPELWIEPLKPLYIRMLKAAEHIDLPVTKEKQNKTAAEWFASLFEPEPRGGMLKILENRRYIPQEILHYGDFLSLIREQERETHV